MFYCEECRKKNKWPEGFAVSRGPCEMCGKTATCHDVPSCALPDRKEKPVAKKKSKKPVELTPADEKRCQCERPNGATFMTFGMAPGLVRCKNKPIVVVTEREATHEDGERGSMSLCPHCYNKFIERMGDDFATVRAIEREGEDKGV